MSKIHVAGDIVLDRYRIDSYVAEGGMQEVYKAYDQNIDRVVALKSPKNLSASKRFQRSALASSKVNHVSVARTLDYFIYNEREYLVEQFINGDTLASVFTKNFDYLDPFMVAHIGYHLIRGIFASHRVGVIHRDLKPSNIMVIGDISFSNVMITDFGIAKLVDEELELLKSEDVENSILASKTLVGAVPYMAPELLLEKSNPELSSDIWSFGAILYHLLSGKPPYSLSFTNVIISYANKEPLKDIPHLSSMKHAHEIVTQLYGIISECMNYDQTQRPSAFSILEKFSSICYSYKERQKGRVYHQPYRSQGFASNPLTNVNVFYHIDEVYGDVPEIGDTICFSSFNGLPSNRAFPVIRCK
ncbi:serine/threonine-protein kinase [Shewanella chilikensis]|uniref:serine/threonine-protein kinase n=1 Tax=Shewanella chilikensis TaxID=558541 RepID=UPI003B674911